MNKLLTIFFYLTFLNAQSFQVSGLVTDSQSKLPISDVNVLSKDSGTSTDNYGKFTFYVENDDSISFSHIGYQSIKLKISENMKIFL